MREYEITAENVYAFTDELGPQMREARFLVALTGAGISRASGLPLGEDEVAGVPVERLFEPDMLANDPQRYFDIYRQWVMRWQKASPNAAHRALARRDVWVITQNIDGLHWRAGTRHVIELHGNLRELRCWDCRQILHSDLVFRERIPRCRQCGNILNPGFSLEGQPVRHFSRAVDWVGRADALMVIGTSLAMEPVRRLPEVARGNRCPVIWINSGAEVAVPLLLE